jgi:hypothetical protein
MFRISQRQGPAGRIAFAMLLGLVTVRPASGQITVTGPLKVEQTAAAGERYQGVIAVRNASPVVQLATLSLADYRFDATGSSSFGAPGSLSRSNTGWITLNQRTVSIPPMGTVSVGYTVTVPAGTTPPIGTYWSVVLVEGEDRPVDADRSKFAITPKFRYAVQVVTHVGQAGECRLGFGAPRVQTETFAIDLTGIGIRGCRPTLKLVVFSAAGILQHSLTVHTSYLYPETSVRQTFAMPPLPPGTYSFLLLADVGAPKLQGARFEVNVR